MGVLFHVTPPPDNSVAMMIWRFGVLQAIKPRAVHIEDTLKGHAHLVVVTAAVLRKASATMRKTVRPMVVKERNDGYRQTQNTGGLVV
jgi:xanthine dehydrogenase iron-sulfur cluster and FAD-binding subunit A